MTEFYYWDLLLIGALVLGLIGVGCVARWLSHEYRLQAISDEINNLPEIDPYLEPAARFSQDGYISPRDLRVQLSTLPLAQLAEREVPGTEYASVKDERRHLNLVIGCSTERIH